MPGTRMKAGLPPWRCAALLDGVLEGLETGDGAGDGVLRAAQVVVDDLDELARALRDRSDEVGDVVVGQAELRGPDGREPVVAAAVGVARHQVVHRHAAAEDDLQQRLEGQDAGDGGERVVLADRVTARDGALDEDAGLAHLGHLRHREGGHRDLGELGQEEHAVGVAVQLTVGPQLGRVVAHDGQDREAERVAGVRVGAVPDLAGSGRAGAGLEAHALALDALAREGVRRAGCCDDRLGDHHQLATVFGEGAAADLDDGVTAEHAGALDGDLHLGTGLQRRDPAGQPAAQGARVLGGAHRGGRALGDGREPHAVRDRGVEAREPRRGEVGVQRVVVAADRGEGAHVGRRGHGEPVETGAGGLLGGLGQRGRGGQLGRARASAHHEALEEAGDEDVLAVGRGPDADLDADHLTGRGVHDTGAGGRDLQLAGLGRHRAHRDPVVEVDQVEQALDRTDAGEDGRPGQPDEGVGHGLRPRGRRRRRPCGCAPGW